MSASPPLGGSGLSDDEDVLDPLIRQLGDLDDIDLEIDTDMFDGSASSFEAAAQDHAAAASVATGTAAAGPAPPAASTAAAAEDPDPMAAERAALYPPPEQPPRKLDWGEEDGGAAPKRKSGSQYEIAPVIRRRHSKEEWSSEIDAGDGSMPKRRNSGSARDADWHLKNNMFGDDDDGYGGPPQDQQYGQYHEESWRYGQHQHYQRQRRQQKQLPKRRHSVGALSADWAIGNDMFGDRGGPDFRPSGYHPDDHRPDDPFGGERGFRTPRGAPRERRRCNSDSKLHQWGDLLHELHESDADDFGPVEFDRDIARRRSLHNEPLDYRHDAGPGPYQQRERSRSDDFATGITPEWAFGHDGGDNRAHDGGGGGRGGETCSPTPFPSTQHHQNQYQHHGAEFNVDLKSSGPSDYPARRAARGKMRRRYSDSRLKRWDADYMLGNSDDDSAADGSEPLQPDDIFGPGGGGGGRGGGNRRTSRRHGRRRPFSSARSDSALHAFSDDDDDIFGDPNQFHRAAAEHFHQYGNDGRDHAQLFAAGIPAYKNDQKVAPPTGMGQGGHSGSDDPTHRKIAEMKEQIALLQSSMAALESTVQPQQAPQGERVTQKPTSALAAPGAPPKPEVGMLPSVEAPAATANASAIPAGTGMSAPVAEDEDNGEDNDDFSEEKPAENSVDPIVKLNQLMAKSQQSLKQLQDYDKSQGLPASHSQTMVNSSRSRRQLLEGKIMKKWDGTPMLEFDEQGRVINQEKKRRGKKKDDGKKDESTGTTTNKVPT